MTDQTMLTESELMFLKRVLVSLLSAKGSCLHSCHDSFAHLLVDGPQHFAIEHLIKEFGAREELADLVISAYLDRFERSPRGLFSDTGALEYALRTASRFPISPVVAERLIGCIARAGWYGRLETCVRDFCKRDPAAEEIVALFDSYVSGATYSTTAEERLATYAQNYLPPAMARAQLDRVRKRNNDNRLNDY